MYLVCTTLGRLVFDTNKKNNILPNISGCGFKKLFSEIMLWNNVKGNNRETRLMERDHSSLWKGLQIMSHRYSVWYRGNFPTQGYWKDFGKNQLSTGKRNDNLGLRFIVKRYIQLILITFVRTFWQDHTMNHLSLSESDRQPWIALT